jgi:hypothetical protein
MIQLCWKKKEFLPSFFRLFSAESPEAIGSFTSAVIPRSSGLLNNFRSGIVFFQYNVWRRMHCMGCMGCMGCMRCIVCFAYVPVRGDRFIHSHNWLHKQLLYLVKRFP